MTRRDWFEISHDGWRQLSASRPLGRLLLEAIQNAFDERAQRIQVRLGPTAIEVVDDAEGGFGDERLVYTVFLSEKRQDPTRRGRMGRGLKELIASMEAATVETVGTTIEFNDAGRRTRRNRRKRGTRLVLRRQFLPDELASARALLGACIPPRDVMLRVDGQVVSRPELVLELPSQELETVVVSERVERAELRSTSVSVYMPREGETPQVYEMGLPVETWLVPWHVDVAQRIPLLEGRDGVPSRFKLALEATLLEAMISRYLDKRDLRGDWVQDVISRWPVKTSLLEAYVSKVFPRGAVLGGTNRANDRAQQIGAHVIEASVISHGAYLALGRVLETSDDYVRRRAAEFEGEDVEPDEEQIAFAAAVRWLARRVAGRVIRVGFFARDPNDAGLLEDAVTDLDTKEIRFNTRASLRFDDLLDARTLGLVLHEIAHLETAEHDHRFIDRLQFLAGHTARVMAEGGTELAAALRRGDPDGRGDH
ncbi:MAG: ATP-binding protein [Deltaproteobacteria bacterium]|nr:MAG: ATP-binding protein [Deltaproteobacteria bacterium]